MGVVVAVGCILRWSGCGGGGVDYILRCCGSRGDGGLYIEIVLV